MPKLTEDKYKKWTESLSPEQRAMAEASNEFADQEMMSDVQNRLEPESRFGGKYGLLPYIGNTRGGGATYRNVMGGPTGRSKVGNSTRRLLGNYKAEKLSEGERYGDSYKLFSELLEEQGLDPIAPGELAFNMLRRDSPEVEATTIQHELVHRALDGSSEFGKDFMEHIEKKYPESYLTDGYEKHKILSAMDGTPKIQERVADTYSGESTDLTPDEMEFYLKRALAISDEMEEFLTPEKQEKYGIRLPIKHTEPKEDKGFSVFDWLRGD